MPRAHSIYVILHPAPACMDSHLIAAFTVKHELATWWDRCKSVDKEEYEIWRIRDNLHRRSKGEISFVNPSELENGRFS